MLTACANTIGSDQFAHLVGLKKNICGSHTLCVDHEESSGTKQWLRMYTTHSEPLPGRVAQSVGHLTRKSGVLGSIPGLATYFRFSFRFFMKGSCQLLAKVCARSTG